MSSEIESRYSEAIDREIARFLEGVSDKADIDPVTVLAAQLRMDASFDRASFARALIGSLKRLDIGNPKTWYCVELLIRELDISDDSLAAALHDALNRPQFVADPQTKYRIWRSIEVAQRGLAPADLAGKAEELKQEAPSLWLNLLLLAHEHNNPDALTARVTELVGGPTPLMTWRALRAKLPDLRKFYPNAAEFRRQIRKIADAISSHDERKELLAAVDDRIGTDLVQTISKPKPIEKSFQKPVREAAMSAARQAKVWSSANADNFQFAPA